MKDRKSNRLEGYDYSEDGCYFVTICVQGREELFGEIIGGEMVLNEAGRMVERTWNELPEFYRGVETDHFQVMPNHIHGVIVITENESVGTGPRACPDVGQSGGVDIFEAGGHGGPPLRHPRACPDNVHPDTGQPQGVGQPERVVPATMSLSDIAHRFKSLTTHRYMANVKDGEWKPFDRKLWQR